MDVVVDTRGFIDVGQEVIASGVGPGKVTSLTDRGFPRVNGVAVAWCVADTGLLFDPFHKAPAQYQREGNLLFAQRMAQKPAVQKVMDLARQFRSADGQGYDFAYRQLERAVYEAILAGPKPIPENPKLESNSNGSEQPGQAQQPPAG